MLAKEEIYTKMGYFNQKGQSLLEVTIAIGIAVLVISALTVTTLIGLRNSQFAQNQVQATKYAQEGLEKVKYMRDKDICILIGGLEYKWKNGDPLINTIWSYNFPPIPDKTFYLTSVGNCQLTADSAPAGEVNLGSKFSRSFILEDMNNNQNQKKIKVQVSWSDAAGSHKSELVTILADY